MVLIKFKVLGGLFLLASQNQFSTGFFHRSSSSFRSKQQQQPILPTSSSSCTQLSLADDDYYGHNINHNNNNNNNDYHLLPCLLSRMKQQQDQVLPLVFRDTLLPRQVHKITIQEHNGFLLDLIRDRLTQDSPYFGMMGLHQTSGRMTRGVEVEILNNYDWNPFRTGITVHLKARRLLELKKQKGNDDDSLIETPQGWMSGKVRYIDISKEEEKQQQGDDDDDVMNLALAMSQAKEFTEPNTSMNESKSLVDQWLELARDSTRTTTTTTTTNDDNKETNNNNMHPVVNRDAQIIDQLLTDLGPMPSWKQPSDCAFWVGALINPTPSLGLAYDIRQPLLLANTAQERTQIVLDALWNSIQRMDPKSSRFEHYGLQQRRRRQGRE